MKRGSIDHKAARARAELATKGPWRTRRTALAHDMTSGLIGNLSTVASFPFDPGEEISAIYDADFCAEARTDVPALCNEIDRLRAAMSRALALYESGDSDGTGGAAEVLRVALGIPEGP